jgi:hypothetical protein
MSAGNFFNTQARAYNLRTVNLTTASGAITYTAKTGRAADSRVFDAFIRVTTTATYNMTITVPDGVHYGQKLTVLFEVEGSAETVDVTCSTGDSGTQLTAAGGYNILEWHGSTLGWALISSSAT